MWPGNLNVVVHGYPGCQRGVLYFFSVAKLQLWAAKPRSRSGLLAPRAAQGPINSDQYVALMNKYISHCKKKTLRHERSETFVCVHCFCFHSNTWARFFKKIQDWVLKSESIWKWILRFFSEQINPRSFGSWCVKGTEESTLEVNSVVPLTHHDPKDLGLICLAKKRKIHFRILSDLRIQSSVFIKEKHRDNCFKNCIVCRCYWYRFTSAFPRAFCVRAKLSQNIIRLVGPHELTGWGISCLPGLFPVLQSTSRHDKRHSTNFPVTQHRCVIFVSIYCWFSHDVTKFQTSELLIHLSWCIRAAKN